MRELYEALGNTQYGETLKQNIRFGAFKPESVTNERWVDMLGADVSNLEHHAFTAGLVNWYQTISEQLNNPLSDEDYMLLRKVAYVHDFAEAIDGDVPDPEKDHSLNAKEKERASFITVASAVTNEPQKLADEVMPVLHGEHPLSRTFRAIEIVGYCSTAERALLQSTRQTGELRIALNSLYTKVWARDFEMLRDYRDLPPIKHYIDSRVNSRHSWINRQRVIQSIMGEHHYQNCSENSGREDEMFHRLRELDDQGMLSFDVDVYLQDYREGYNG